MSQEDKEIKTPNPQPIDNALEKSKIEEETWAELTQDWQSQATPKTDVAALVKSTRKRMRAAKFCFALNIIATLGLILAFFYGIFDGQWGKPFNVYLGLGGLLSVVFVYFETKVRLATWAQISDSPEKAIENAIASSESSMKYMLITKISFLPFLPLINWFIYTVSQTNNKDALPGYLMANGFMLGVYLVVEYLHQKRKREYQQLLKINGA
jgi:hypothetical protein